ncbi:AfsR family transcriptional regulator [Micromonospora deserti]|uniref:AfsR family transcriptional regulator n=1 Tax=Micromonospora deserti TaxID=2070366 RepID=A0A2W2CWB5_9ACTN|nr:AfsR family transcriptional regulator [Micromonospora deserti]
MAYGADGPVGLGPARQRTLLAALLLEPGGAVAFDQLVDRVWGERPPQRARVTLHTYLSRLRTVLGGAGGPALVRRMRSYALEVDPGAVDLHRFRAMASGARRADDGRAATLWGDALGLWRGEPFAGLDSDWLRAVRAELEAERLAAALDRHDVLLRRGEHGRLVPELTAAAAAHPLDERLAGQLMLALYHCGRQADALAHYRLLHDRLVEEVGSDPGPGLRELHRRILRHDAELAPAPLGLGGRRVPTEPPDRGAGDPRHLNGGRAATSPPAATGLPRRPAQLPADVPDFTGRATDLRRLDKLLDERLDSGTAPAVVITAIAGAAGVGKTALAVHWANRMTDRFPDGQLYVNLRGYDPDQPMPAADALARFLTALGVAGQDIPLDVDERAAKYRSELAGHRMLILLDNAASVAQVRPLLPGSSSSLVVVTSRDRLAGLVALHGAHRLDLDLLPAAEAVDLLRRLIGSRVEAEPEAAATLAEQCARLPLALRVAAELAASRPDSTLAELVAELADRQTRLHLLDAGDPYAAVREVFSWSIHHLSPDAVRTFRLVGLHPGPDLDPYAAAALTGTGLDQTRRTLELLTQANLVHRTGRGRYGMHDLLRAYAAHLANDDETEQLRQAAQQRLLDYYLTTAVSATDTLHPGEAHYRPEATASATLIPDLSDPKAARAWLDAERYCLVAVAAYGRAVGASSYVAGLARALYRYLSDAHLTEMVAINDHAYHAAEQAGDHIGSAHALRQLGTAYNRLSRYQAAVEHLQQALARFREAGDLVGEALTLTSLGTVGYRLGNHDDAMDHNRRSIELSRQAGDRLAEAFALNNLGVAEERVGRYADAGDHYRQALAIFREIGARYCVATALLNVANVELRQGDYAPAATNLRQSLAILQPLGGPITEAHALDTLGLLHLRLGEPEEATGYFRQALARFREAGERNGQAWSVNGLGEAAQLAGDATTALAHHSEALAIATGASTRHQQARAHTGLGHAHKALGDPDQAGRHYERAYAIYAELGMPDAEDVRVYLAPLAGSRRQEATGLRAFEVAEE